jgi:hypothetical protein
MFSEEQTINAYYLFIQGALQLVFHDLGGNVE